MRIRHALFIISLSFFSFACSKSTAPDEEVNNDTPYIKAIKDQLKEDGFSTFNLVEVDNGFIVEGDIYISKDHFSSTNSSSLSQSVDNIQKNKSTFIAGAIEQYRVFNTVSVYTMPGVSAGRILTVSVDENLPEIYQAATDSAINRYNNAGLAFQLMKTYPGASDISISQSTLPAGIYALSSFPTEDGNPYKSIQLNLSLLGEHPNIGYLTTIIAHEIGHCIGLRHTNYVNKKYDCNYTMPEVSGTLTDLSAVQIPGTSPDGDAQSFMLACSSGENRPFTQNDIIALRYIYGEFGAGDDGSFYKDSLSGSTYVIMEGRPRKIGGNDILKSLFGTNPSFQTKYVPFDLPYGTSIMDGSGIATSEQTGKIYFIDNSSNGTVQKRLIENPIVLQGFFFNENFFNNYPDEVLNQIPTGDPLTLTGENGRFVRDGSTGAVFVAMDNTLRQLNTLNVIYNVFTMNSDHIPNIVNFQTRGTDILSGSMLVKSSKSNEVYFIDVHKNASGKIITEKRLVANMTIFDRYHFENTKIQAVSSAALEEYSNGTPLY